MAEKKENALIAIAFDGQFTAEGMLEHLEKMQKEGILKLADAVIAFRGQSANIEIKQTHSVTGKSSLKGSGVGLLAGMLLGGPILGLAAGAAVGAIAGKMKDYGIDDDFINSVSKSLGPDSSAIFLMVEEVDGPEVLKRLKPYKGTVLSASLTPEQQKRLEDALSEETFD